MSRTCTDRCCEDSAAGAGLFGLWCCGRFCFDEEMPEQTDFSLGDRWAAQPLWVPFFFAVVVSGGAGGAAMWAKAPEEELRDPYIAFAMGALLGLLLGGLLTLVRRRAEKRTGVAELDHHARLVVGRAMRTGRPPADPALHPLLRRLAASVLERERKSRRVAPVFYGFLLLVAVWNTLVVSPWFAVLILWFGVLLAYSLIMFPRVEARMLGLERALAEAETETGERGRHG